MFVDRLDLATARALQYARTLNPDELRAVHFVLDTVHADQLESQWAELGLSRFPLDLVECPDRRLTRASMELIAEVAADGQTEVSVLLPHRVFAGIWQRVLHDRTADHIAAFVDQLPNVNATIVPFQLGKRRKAARPLEGGGRAGSQARCTTPSSAPSSSSRAAPSGGAKTAAGARRRAAERRLTSGLAAGAVPIGNAAALAPAGPRRGADQDGPRPAAGRCLLARVHDRGRDGPAAARVPGAPARGRHRAGGPRRGRGHGRRPRPQPRHGEPALLDHLDSGESGQAAPFRTAGHGLGGQPTSGQVAARGCGPGRQQWRLQGRAPGRVAINLPHRNRGV